MVLHRSESRECRSNTPSPRWSPASISSAPRSRSRKGSALHGEEISLPQQTEIPLHGTALQCRVTTEDPANDFVPDYGRMQTYRSPAGFGIRLDGASAYGGAVISPYYDSLLVKVTAWGSNFKQACQRMDRALREFRIRGVKTNIPFLENVVNHPAFQSGEPTTSFLDETPELFRFPPRRDRATKLLTYLAEVIVNGNPEVARRSQANCPARARFRSFLRRAPAEGTRQLLDQLGPERFAEWTRAQKRLLLTDTTFRDAHQSLMATRVRTYDLLAIADYVAQELPQTLQPRDVGRRHVRCSDAFSARRSVEAPAGPAASVSRTSVFRCCCALRTQSAIRPIRTM